MKIGILTENPFLVGGVQRVVNSLANVLSEMHTVEIICLARNLEVDRSIYNLDDHVTISQPEELNKVGRGNIIKRGLRFINKKVFGIKNLNFLEFIYLTEQELKSLAKYINEQNFDVVIAVQAKLSLYLGSIKDRVDCKCIGWEHNSYQAYYETAHRYYWNQQELMHKYFMRLDACVVLSDEDQNAYAEKLGLRTTRIYNPVGVKSSRDKISKKDNIVLWVGRLVISQKGLDYLIEIAKKSAPHLEDWKFYLVGDGPDKQVISRKIEDNGLQEKVVLCGSTKDVEKYYEKASILISTSRWEGFGLTLIEGMNFGVPCVCFNNSGPAEIIGDTNAGVLIPKYDTDQFSKKLLELIRDREKRCFMSTAAKNRGSVFQPEQIAEEWQSLF